MFKRKADQLLDEPLLTDAEIGFFLADLKGLQLGSVKGVVGTDFWQWAMVELSRRQVKRTSRNCQIVGFSHSLVGNRNLCLGACDDGGDTDSSLNGAANHDYDHAGRRRLRVKRLMVGRYATLQS